MMRFRRRFCFHLATSAALLIVCSSSQPALAGCQSIRLVFPEDVVVGGATDPFAVGDLDGDHIPDLVLRVGGSGHLVVMLNNGLGHFQEAPGPSPFVGFSISCTSVFDVDGDADQDIVVLLGGPSRLRVLRNIGDATFEIGAERPVPAESSNLFVGDVNNDSHADLVANQDGNGGFSLLAGDGAGGFSPSGSWSNTRALALIDMDQDGLLDLLTYESGMPEPSPRSAIRYGMGAGAFTQPSLLPPEGSSTTEVVAADFTGDALPDIVWVSSAGPSAPMVRVIENLGKRVFSPSVSGVPALIGTDRLVMCADLDEDDDLDVLVTTRIVGNPDTFWISTIQNDGKGTLGERRDLFVTARIRDWKALDADNDHDNDLVALRDGSQISVFFNACRAVGALIAGDANGDGIVNFADITSVLANFGPD